MTNGVFFVRSARVLARLVPFSKMRRHSCILLLVGFAFALAMSGHAVFAQPYVEVRPISFGDDVSQRRLNISVDMTELMPSARIDTKFMPALNNDSLARRDAANKPSGPFVFGHSLNMRLGTDNAGTWETLPNGDRIWRLRVVSPGAFSLNFLYSKFVIPEGGLFFIYNDVQVEKNKDNLVGAFSAEHSSTGLYATDLLKGSVAVLEYYEPRAVRGKGAIMLSNVIHGFRDAFGYLASLTPPSAKEKIGETAAVACHLDVNGLAGVNYQTIKRSVAVVLAGNGTWLCSGSLMNNTGDRYRPYFLTALHCADNGDGILDSFETQPLQSWMFKFNYESGGLQPITYGSGCSLRAGISNSDGLLVELNQKVSSSLYMNGWSASPSTPANPIASIHHPGGVLKKLSVSNNLANSTVYQATGYYSAQSWQIDWDFSNGANTGGKSEYGSSGGPLFNGQLQVIGQCYGGSPASIPCGLPQTVYFGKLDAGWSAFQPWLNSSGGVTSYNGIAPMNVNVTGPSKLVPGNTGTLTATISGGVPPYQCDWYVSYPPSTTEYYLSSGQTLAVYGNNDEQQFVARVRDAASPQNKIDEAFKTIVNGFGTPNSRAPVEEIILEITPNPSSESSFVSYTLPDDATVSVEICNALLQPLLTLAAQARQRAGRHEFTVQKRLSAGAYFVRLTAQTAAGRVSRTSSSIIVTK